MLVGGVALVHGPAADLRVTEDDGVPGHLTVGVGRCRYRQEGAPRKTGRAGRGRVRLGPGLPGRTEPTRVYFSIRPMGIGIPVKATWQPGSCGLNSNHITHRPYWL